MNLPDGRPLVSSDGMIPEPSAAEGRLILWLRGDRIGGYQHWERVSSVAHAEMTAGGGMRAIEANSIPARRWAGGAIGKLFRRRESAGPDRHWTLPDGTSAEQCGPRRADLVLAWMEDETNPIDEARIRERWEKASGVRSIGAGVYLVSGIEPAPPKAATGPAPDLTATGSPLQLAERALDAARGGGDGRRLAAALGDLAAASLGDKDARRAEGLLGEAIEEARRLGDRSMELGLMIDLGLVALVSGRSDRAREVLGPLPSRARAIGDRPAEKLALDRLGQARSRLGEHVDALACFVRALEIASGLGDGRHEADLLWRVAIEHAELDRPGQAAAHARAAVALMRRLGLPQAAWYAHHLDGFHSGGPGATIAALAPAGGAEMGYPGGAIDTTSVAARVAPPPSGGPGPLRMALSAAGSMAKFLGSGFRTASADLHRARVEACSTCEHHTGLRCRVCGCFTAAKARLEHERCPVGRWRA